MGFQAVLRDQAVRGEMLLRQSLSISQEIDDRALIATGLGRLGIGYWFCGKFKEAHTLISQEIEIRRELGNRGQMAFAFSTLSAITANLGHYAEACTKAEAALNLIKEIGTPWVRSWSLWPPRLYCFGRRRVGRG